MIKSWWIAWLQAAPWLRVVSFSGLSALGAALQWGCWLSPATEQQQRLEQQQFQLQQRWQQQLALLSARPALLTLQRQMAQLQQPEEAAHFSLPALLKATGATLEHWHPGAHGGELTLTLSWPQFAMLLGYLQALRPAVDIPRFSLQRADSQLKLQLELRYAD